MRTAVWRLLGVRCDGVQEAAPPRHHPHDDARLRRLAVHVHELLHAARARSSCGASRSAIRPDITWLVQGPARPPRPVQFPKRATTTTPGEPESWRLAAARPTCRSAFYSITQTGIVGGGLPWELIDIACDGGIVQRDGPRRRQDPAHTAASRMSPARSRTRHWTSRTRRSRRSSRPSRRCRPVPTLATSSRSRSPRRRRRPTSSGRRALPAGAVQTGFGPRHRVPAVFRTGSPEHRLLQAAGDATSRDPRVARGHRSRVDAMVVRVPRLGIRGRLQRLDVAAGHRLRVPADPRRVGWWSGGALPGPAGLDGARGARRRPRRPGRLQPAQSRPQGRPDHDQPAAPGGRSGTA